LCWVARALITVNILVPTEGNLLLTSKFMGSIWCS
jgi:hypothetical protein